MDPFLSQDPVLSLWGKTDAADSTRFHPLLYHLLDVGAVARELWRTVLPSHLKAELQTAVGLENSSQTEQLVVLLCAQHDLGKAAAFQCKAQELWPDVSRIGDNPNLNGSGIAHATITAILLPELLPTCQSGWSAPQVPAKSLSRVIGGHHGLFPSSTDLQPLGDDAKGGAAWTEVRCGLLQALFEGLYPGNPTVQITADRLHRATLIPLVGGLTSVADWIGSDQTYFPTANLIALSEYIVGIEERAKYALDRLGWTPKPKFAAPAKFGQIFRSKQGAPFKPNDVQRIVVEQVDRQSAPYLMIVEAAMGDGKTEAALYAVDRSLSTGGAHGFYFALPTQATGDAMFNRICNDYLTPRGHECLHNIQLVHGGSFLSDAYRNLQLAAMGDDQKRGDDVLSAEAWFTNKKRALIAPIGVGTIDQALLSVLQTKHWFVRMFGLAGKVIVFDEVHAYDVYMGALLDRLLSWLQELGCTVILLSATLPPVRRNELLEAWGARETAQAAKYPRLTIAGHDGVAHAIGIPGQPASKTVSLNRIGTEPLDLVNSLTDSLPNGGCAAVICNTVGRAQSVFRAVRDQLDPREWDVLLVHARMPHVWRKERDKMVLALFGKGGDRTKPTVIVGTQVLEQSLDYDVDWMASDMAPVDLLLQRMGRLWRHMNENPQENRPVSEPRFVIACSITPSGLPEFPEGTTYVYDQHVLLRTYLELRGRPEIELPGQIEGLVERAYSSDVPLELSAEWKRALDEAREKYEHGQDVDRKKAESMLVPHPSVGLSEVLEPGSTLDSTARILFEDEDPRVHETVRAATRLGPPSISIVCAGTDVDGNPLAAIPEREPTFAEVRNILEWSLNVSHRVLFKALLRESVPEAWRAERHLRFHRIVRFERGEAVVTIEEAKVQLRLSKQEGLVIEGDQTD